MKPSSKLLAFLLGSSLLAAVATTNAQTSTWTGASDNNWGTAGNWNPSGVPGTSADILFDGTASGFTPFLGTADRRVDGGITFNSATSYNVQLFDSDLSTARELRVTGISVLSGNHTITGVKGTSGTGTLRLEPGTFDIASGSTLTFDVRLRGGGTNDYTKTGDGTLVFNANIGGSGSFNVGTFTISQGVVRWAETRASGNSANKFSVTSGAALELTGGVTQQFNTGVITLNGTGISNGGALRSISGDNWIENIGSGSIVLASNSSIGVDAGSSLLIGSVISGSGDLTQVGSGTLTLSGTNTYTGDTLVQAGTLIITGSTTSNTTVASGGTLKGSGSMTGTVTVQSGGTLASGTSIESLSMGTLTLNSGSSFDYEIDRSAASLGVAGDLTAITGDLNIATGAVLTIQDLGLTGTWNLGTKLTLMSYTGAWNNGLFTYDSQTLNNGDTFILSGATWQFFYDDTVAGSNFTDDLTGSSFVTMTVIPEPTTALLGGLGMLALLRRRR